MFKKNILYPVIIYLITIPAFAQQNRLAQIDSFLSEYKNVKLNIKIEDIQGGVLKKSKEYIVYKNKNASLIEMSSGRDKGNRVLLTHKGMYLAVKKSNRAIRITPLQRLLGNSSYGDLANIDYVGNYEISTTKQEGDMVQLTLKTKSKIATYKKIILWVDKITSRPLKAGVYLASGKLFKNIEYVVEKGRLKSMIYTDIKKSEKFTRMSILNVIEKRLPKRYFRVNGMKDKIN